MFIAILDYDENKRVTKFLEFGSENAANVHADKYRARFPKAFVTVAPNGGVQSWLVDDADAQNKTLSSVPPVADPLTTQEQINELKAQITPDRMREAVIDKGGVGLKWLSDIDAEIDALIAQQ